MPQLILGAAKKKKRKKKKKEKRAMGPGDKNGESWWQPTIKAIR